MFKMRPLSYFAAAPKSLYFFTDKGNLEVNVFVNICILCLSLQSIFIIAETLWEFPQQSFHSFLLDCARFLSCEPVGSNSLADSSYFLLTLNPFIITVTIPLLPFNGCEGKWSMLKYGRCAVF